MRTSTNAWRSRLGALAFVCLISGLARPAAAASSSDGVWNDVDERGIVRTAARQIVPTAYRTVRLDRSRLDGLLQAVPLERDQPLPDSRAEFELPLPDGKYARFRIVESPVMEPALAKRYPDLRTWVGQGIDDPAATLRLDLTPKGFHAQVLSAHGTLFVDPYQPGDTRNYISYRKQDHHHGETLRCSVTGEEIDKESPVEHATHAKLARGGSVRTYRLAMAATGEYTLFHGGGKADALAGIVTTINRVNGIYERDVGVRFVLVANNDAIIFTDAATDPYGNDADDLDLTQDVVDEAIGFGNYDVGHLVGTGGGGVAFLGVICSASKAGGLTGSGSPIGDGFDVDYVAHEMGHQFGGQHTFNGAGVNCAGGNRSASAAYEPGSGVTIQAYAGICGNDDLQPNSEDYFHRKSLEQIIAHTTSGSGGTCGTLANTANSTPTVTAPADRAIPVNTPFELTAVGGDADNDELTYVWEQYDLGTRNNEGVLTDAGNRPLFRGFAPTSDATRTFPSLRYILGDGNNVPNRAPLPGNGATEWFTGERLPTTDRNLTFRVTVRDNRADGGGTNEDEIVLNVEPGTPFAVTAPNTAVSWAAGSAQTVTWNAGSTAAAPISTAKVRILLSLDGGYTWPVELSDSLVFEANDGSASVTIPAGTPGTARARIKIKAVDNVFFDISNADFTITGTNTPPLIVPGSALPTRQGSPMQTAVVATVSDAPNAASTIAVDVSGAPAELTVSAVNVNGNVELSAEASCSLVAPTSGVRTYPVLLTATDAQGAASADFVNVDVRANQAPTLGTYTVHAVARDTSTPFAPSAEPLDPNDNYAGLISVTPTVLPGGGTLSVAADGTVTVATTAGTTFGTYPVRVRIEDDCGAVEIREFQLQVAASTPVLGVTGTSVPTGNGLIEPAECNDFEVTLTNSGTVTATNVLATLGTDTPEVTVTQAIASFADIPPGQSRTTQAAFQVSTAAGLVCLSPIDFDIEVTYDGGGSPYLDTIGTFAGQPAAVDYSVTTASGATLPAGGVLVAGSAADDALINLAAPFAFTLYGNPVAAGTTLRAGTNGTLQIGATGGSRKYANTALPASGTDGNFPGDAFPAASPVLMPFWDDLRLDTTNGGGLFTQTIGVMPNRQWIIEWRGRHWTQAAGVTNTQFAVVFSEGSDSFDYVYVLTSGGGSINGGSATIGIQAATTGDIFTQHALNQANAVTPGTRLTFARAPASCSSGTGACVISPVVRVVQSGGNTAVIEGNAGDSYAVVLATEPSAEVTITLEPSDDLGVPSMLTFTTLDWNVPQIVTVTAADDRIVEGAHGGSIAHEVAGGDYEGMNVADVNASVADNDSAAYRFAVSTSSAPETAGTLQVSALLDFTTAGSGPQTLDAPITVPVTVGTASTASGGGVDYTLGSNQFVFPATGDTQSLDVTLAASAVAEGNETVVLELGTETGGTAAQQAVVTTGSPASHALTIVDVDTAGVTLAESGGDTAVTEGDAGGHLHAGADQPADRRRHHRDRRRRRTVGGSGQPRVHRRQLEPAARGDRRRHRRSRSGRHPYRHHHAHGERRRLRRGGRARPVGRHRRQRSRRRSRRRHGAPARRRRSGRYGGLRTHAEQPRHRRRRHRRHARLRVRSRAGERELDLRRRSRCVVSCGIRQRPARRSGRPRPRQRCAIHDHRHRAGGHRTGHDDHRHGHDRRTGQVSSTPPQATTKPPPPRRWTASRCSATASNNPLPHRQTKTPLRRGFLSSVVISLSFKERVGVRMVFALAIRSGSSPNHSRLSADGFGRLAHRIVRMRGPVRVTALVHALHRDAVVDRTHVHAQIAAHALGIDHFEVTLAVLLFQDGLVRGVLAGDVAQPALHAQVLVDPRLDVVLQIEELPVGDVADGVADEIVERAVALRIHPVRQPADHVVDDAETVMHGGGAHLHRARAQRHELGGVAPGADAADAADRLAVGFFVARDLRDHVQRDRLHGRPAIAAVRALAVDGGRGRHQVEIDAGDRIDGVDQRHRIGAAAEGGARRVPHEYR